VFIYVLPKGLAISPSEGIISYFKKVSRFVEVTNPHVIHLSRRLQSEASLSPIAFSYGGLVKVIGEKNAE
jgi:hypothetical protein